MLCITSFTCLEKMAQNFTSHSNESWFFSFFYIFRKVVNSRRTFRTVHRGGSEWKKIKLILASFCLKSNCFGVMSSVSPRAPWEKRSKASQAALLCCCCHNLQDARFLDGQGLEKLELEVVFATALCFAFCSKWPILCQTFCPEAVSSCPWVALFQPSNRKWRPQICWTGPELAELCVEQLCTTEAQRGPSCYCTNTNVRSQRQMSSKKTRTKPDQMLGNRCWHISAGLGLWTLLKRLLKGRNPRSFFFAAASLRSWRSTFSYHYNIKCQIPIINGPLKVLVTLVLL